MRPGVVAAGRPGTLEYSPELMAGLLLLFTTPAFIVDENRKLSGAPIPPCLSETATLGFLVGSFGGMTEGRESGISGAAAIDLAKSKACFCSYLSRSFQQAWASARTIPLVITMYLADRLVTGSRILYLGASEQGIGLPVHQISSVAQMKNRSFPDNDPRIPAFAGSEQHIRR